MGSVDVYHKILKEYFDYDTFRGAQIDIIDSICNGCDTMVVMQTGGGKSICFQLPALVFEGTAIVISPLIALMKDQIDSLIRYNIPATCFNSTLNKKESKVVIQKMLNGELKLLYIAPESLRKETTVEFLKQSNISFIAVDEAHCISEWGHDFRSEYRNIKDTIASIKKDLPIIALTATATPKIQSDIMKNLRMDEENANIFRSTFNRKNLYYEIKPKQHVKQQLINLLKTNEGQSAIIYCLSRKKVEEIAEFLQMNKIKAVGYHAGIEATQRKKNQENFLNETIDVVVATIAFGMGIDKSNVRLVIHYDVPKSLEGYYQETGRSGRDGKNAKCLMYYSPKDVDRLRKFTKDKSLTERENSQILLEEVAGYAESSICRRKLLLNYFGEDYEVESVDRDCCDNCNRQQQSIEGSPLYLLALRVLKGTSESCSIHYLKDIIIGNSTSDVVTYKHDQMEYFGHGKAFSDQFKGLNLDLIWVEIFRQAIVLGLLKKTNQGIAFPKMSKKGVDFIENPYSIPFSLPIDYSNLGEEEEINLSKNKSTHVDNELFSVLSAYRADKVKVLGIPKYVICSDVALEEIATFYPTKEEELRQISGFGKGKVQKYGKEICAIVQKYLNEHEEIDKMSTFVVISKGVKSRNKIEIIRQVDRKIDLETIAENLSMKPLKLLEEMEMIVASGTNLNICYYVNHALDLDSQEDIKEYFLEIDNYIFKDVMDELGEDYTEEEVKLMHIHFLNEYAN